MFICNVPTCNLIFPYIASTSFGDINFTITELYMILFTNLLKLSINFVEFFINGVIDNLSVLVSQSLVDVFNSLLTRE